MRSQRSRSEVAQWISWGSIDPNFKMDMGSGTGTAAADLSDHLARVYAARGNNFLAHMCIKADDSASVVNKGADSVSASTKRRPE